MPTRIRRFQLGDERGIADLIVQIQRSEFGIAITYDDQPDKSGFRLVAGEALPPSFPRMAVDSRFYAIEL